MSISRTAYLSLAALLAIAPAACGGDDDDGDGGGAADSGGGGQADAGGEADAGGGEPDAGGEADAAPPIEGDQYLLGLQINTSLGIGGVVRLIATVAIDEKAGTADFQLQPLISPDCPDQGKDGAPVGDPRVETDVAIAKDGSFELVLADATFPAGSVGFIPALCAAEVAGSITATGSVASGLPCGELTGTVTAPAMADVTGSFGAIAIEPGDELPDPPATACK